MGPTERAAVHPVLSALPDGWNWLPLKRIITEPLKYGAALTGNDDPSSGPRYIRITDIDTATRLHSENAKYLSYEEAQNFLLEPGDLLFARSGATVGKTYLFIGDEPSCFAGYLIKAKPRVLELGIWLSYFSQSSTYWEWIAITLNKATLENVSAGKYKELLVPLPPAENLHNLLGYLKAKTAEIDGLVAKLERERELLERYRRELIARTVTRGLNPDAPMRDSGIEWIGDMPEHWLAIPFVAKLSAVKELNTDLRIRNALQFKNGEIVEKHGWDLLDRKLDATLAGYKKVQPGMIVINGLNLNYDFKTKRVGMVRTNGVITSAYITLKVLPGNDERYLCYLLKSMDFRLLFHGMTEGVRKILSWADLRRVALPCPPENEQTQIAEFLDAKMSEISSAVADIDKQIELLGKYRKQVISDVVTGKIRVGDVQ